MILSDYVAYFFETYGLKNMFMVSGGGCMHLVNSFGKSKIRYICTHHEQSAAMASEAYSKMTGDISLTLITSGPGATNTITGLLGAYQDSVPCIFLSGQSKRSQTVYNSKLDGLRQFGVQEVNIIPIIKSLTKYCCFINDPQSIRYHLEKAIYYAKTDRPGPTWLDIPLDVQNSIIDECKLKSFIPPIIDSNNNLIEDINFIINELKKSNRPVVIAGHGIRLGGAIDLFHKMIEKLSIPVVTPIMGIDLLATDHPLNMGRIGTKGTRAGNFTMQNADLIISIGSRLAVSVIGHEYELFAREALKIVIDIDKIEHQKKTINIDKFINCDAYDFIKMFLSFLSNEEIKVSNSWINFCKKQKEKYPVCLKKYDDDSKGINYYKFVDLITSYVKSNVTIVSDAGSSFYVVSQAANIKEGQRYITSGAIATMGFGLPAAIGVAVASSSNMVALITGEGSFNQNPQELAVLKYHNFPVKVFVMNNNGYLSIRQTQRKFFDSNFVGESKESGLYFPNIEFLAKAYNLKYLHIDSLLSLETNLDYIFKNDEPMLVDVMLLEDQEIIPTNATLIQEYGKMISKPLEDMYPFLPREEFLENLKVKPVN